MKKKRKISIPLLIFRIISLIIIIICLIEIYKWQKNNSENGKLQADLQESASTSRETSEENVDSRLTLSVDFNNLVEKNPDTVGYLKINNSDIEFPVVQTTDNQYYLKHNFKKEYNGAGWIFADYSDSFDDLSQNTLIYGHNRRNGTMFSDLKMLLDEKYSLDGDNSYFLFNTKSNKYRCIIFSVTMKKAATLSIPVSFKTDEEYLAYIDEVKQASYRKLDVEVPATSKIITLCTCDNTNQNRVLVYALLEEYK